MNKKDFSNIKLGILGGGQLGKMLCQAASSWDIKTFILDPSVDCPAKDVCNSYVQGDFRDYESVCGFGKFSDLLTIEIEHVSAEALEKLEKDEIEVRPSSKILKIIQDKGLQKEFYEKNGLPTSRFTIVKNKSQIFEMLQNKKITYPFVQKLRRFGYDGRGVQLINNGKDFENLLDGECVVEDLVQIEKELSVIVAQNKIGDIKCFQPVEMVFNSDVNLVDYLISPANISDDLSDRAMELAVKTIKAFDLYGILAVEMFLDKNGQLLINEVAPRPHNSGHHTIESCVTSQYEQHIRSLYDLPLGETSIISPTVMLNLVGEPGYEGSARYEGFEECVKVDGAKFHIYGKKLTKPFRKMGHVTIMDSNIDTALEKAEFIKENLKVVS